MTPEDQQKELHRVLRGSLAAYDEGVENGLVLLCELGWRVFDQFWAQQPEHHVNQNVGGTRVALNCLCRQGFDEASLFGYLPRLACSLIAIISPSSWVSSVFRLGTPF